MAGRSPGRVRRPARAAIGRGGCERDKASARKDGNAAPARVPCRLSRLDLRRRGVCGPACAGRPRERLSPALTPGQRRRLDLTTALFGTDVMTAVVLRRVMRDTSVSTGVRKELGELF